MKILLIFLLFILNFALEYGFIFCELCEIKSLFSNAILLCLNQRFGNIISYSLVCLYKIINSLRSLILYISHLKI